MNYKLLLLIIIVGVFVCGYVYFDLNQNRIHFHIVKINIKKDSNNYGYNIWGINYTHVIEYVIVPFKEFLYREKTAWIYIIKIRYCFLKGKKNSNEQLAPFEFFYFLYI